MLDPNSFGPWGKLQRDVTGALLAWHPLVDHCADVAACCEALLTETLIGERFRVASGLATLDNSVVARLCVCAFLHDLGKANRGFQNKALTTAVPKAGHVRELLVVLNTANSATLRVLAEAARLNEIEAFGDPDAAEGGATMLWTAVCHHGEPAQPSGPIDTALWDDASMVTARALANAAFAMFPEALQKDGTAMPASSAAQHAFAGIVMLADWLGSDTRFFPYTDPAASPSDRATFARAAAHEALRATGLLASEARKSRSGVPVSMASVSPYSLPRGVQKPVLETAWTAGGGSLSLIEAETGAGKTEAALVHFLRLHAEGLVDGMYFALPTRTAAKQLYTRVCEAVARAFPDAPSRPPVVLAVPGYLSVDGEQGQRLPGFEVLWQENRQLSLRDRGWASEHPKRFLAAAIAVGTIDQALLSTLPVGHAHLRQAALSRQLLVVDEVHASDAYMTKLLQGVLARLRAANGHALLLSATLGTVAQATYFQDRKPPALADACALPYPRLRFQAAENTEISVEEAGCGKTVSLRTEPWMEDADAVAQTALAAAREGAKVLIIRNTVRSALETQRALEALRTSEALFAVDGTVTIHHSRFAERDRGRLDEAIEGALGKTRTEARRGIVVVGTQTVQQSLDLDADFLLTDLCPVDVLLQRIGRLHRHARPAEERPVGFATPKTVVLVTPRPLAACIGADGTLRGPAGLGTVYDNGCILQATLDLVLQRPSWSIPSENRDLVERATHPEALAAVAATMGPHGDRHRVSVGGSEAAKRGAAATALIDESIPFCDMAFGNHDERFTTRLGADDRRLEFPEGLPSPFGGTVNRLAVPGWLAKGVPADATPTAVEATADGARFRFGDLHFSYTRHGLTRLERDAETQARSQRLEELDG